MVTIDKNVPFPSARDERRPMKYPFDQLEVGDSFVIPIHFTGDKKIDKNRSVSVSVSILKAKKQLGFKFASRTVEGGKRVWRTA